MFFIIFLFFINFMVANLICWIFERPMFSNLYLHLLSVSTSLVNLRFFVTLAAKGFMQIYYIRGMHELTTWDLIKILVIGLWHWLNRVRFCLIHLAGILSHTNVQVPISDKGRVNGVCFSWRIYCNGSIFLQIIFL